MGVRCECRAFFTIIIYFGGLWWGFRYFFSFSLFFIIIQSGFFSRCVYDDYNTYRLISRSFLYAGYGHEVHAPGNNQYKSAGPAPTDCFIRPERRTRRGAAQQRAQISSKCQYDSGNGRESKSPRQDISPLSCGRYPRTLGHKILPIVFGTKNE